MKFLTDTLAKFSQNIFEFLFVSDFFFYYEKKEKKFSGEGSNPLPPPLADASVKNASFFDVIPLRETFTISDKGLK